MRWRFSRGGVGIAVIPAKAGIQGCFFFVLAFVVIVASRVSARQPSSFLCLAKERNQRKATPLSASPARLSARRGSLRCSRRAGKRSNSALRASNSRAS